MEQTMELQWRTIRAYNDLLTRFEQCIECVEEFLLSPLFARKKLYIVDDEHIHLPVLPAESFDLLLAYCFDHLIRELLGSDVEHNSTRIRVMVRMPYPLQEVRFAKSHAPVDEERVVFAPGLRRGCLRRCMGQTVT